MALGHNRIGYNRKWCNRRTQIVGSCNYISERCDQLNAFNTSYAYSPYLISRYPTHNKWVLRLCLVHTLSIDAHSIRDFDSRVVYRIRVAEHRLESFRKRTHFRNTVRKSPTRHDGQTDCYVWHITSANRHAPFLRRWPFDSTLSSSLGLFFLLRTNAFVRCALRFC